MTDVEGARSFGVPGATYDAFMGRYSMPLAELFADAAAVTPGQTAIDVGCGPGALTGELVRRLGVDGVRACDPSPTFRQACSERYPGLVVAEGRAESIPFEDDAADRVLAQLVLHFVSDPLAAATEMARVARPGGLVAACVWDVDRGMEMLRAFWDAALRVDPNAPDEAWTLRFGRPGEISELFREAGFEDVTESTLAVRSTYASFDELWEGFLAGVGPAGTWCVGLDEQQRDELRAALFEEIGSPEGAFTLGAVARCSTARVP